MQHIAQAKPASAFLGAMQTYQHIFHFYSISESSCDVYSFLAKHTEVADVLLEAKDILESYFSNSKFLLELQYDPEDGSETLYVVIKHENEYEQSRAELDRFDKVWFLPRLSRVGISLNFALQP